MNQIQNREINLRGSFGKIVLLLFVYAISANQISASVHTAKKNSNLFKNSEEILIKSNDQPQTQFSIRGTVTDNETGETIPGVTVLEVGTSNGTITDFDGRYTIKLSAENASLVYSFVGFKTTKVNVAGRSTIDISLESDIEQLQEVVVVGFATQSKVTTTGAISGIAGKDLEKVSAPSVGESLFGKVPGLQITQITGQPGGSDPDINIRGISSFNGSSPFIIIDGVPSSTRDFMQLSGKSIANISVLKDASATAVYGVRGADGVIIVTTKRGEAGKMVIEADVSMGYQSPTYLLDFANSYEWATAFNETMTNDGRTEGLVPQADIDHYRNQDQPLIYPDNDWVDEYFNSLAKEILADLRVSGGSEKLRYFVNLNYLNQDGNLVPPSGESTFGYNRFNVTSNVDVDITPTTLLKFTNRARIGITKTPINGAGVGVWRNLYEAPPMGTVGFLDGDFVNNRQSYRPYAAGAGGIEELLNSGSFRQDTENRLSLNMDLTQKLEAISPALEGLEFRARVGYRAGFDQRLRKREKAYSVYESIYNIDAVATDPNLPDSAVVLSKLSNATPATWDYEYLVGDRYIYWEAGLQYKRKFGVHDVGALLLYNQNKDYYPPNNWAYNNIATGNAGLVGRVTYDFKNKYLAEFNLGYNGSENFAEERRFGFFPSVSGGWVVSEEAFLSNVSFINFLKVRGSYGLVGSDQVGGSARFIYLGDIYDRSDDEQQGYNFGDNSPEFQRGVQEALAGNQLVTWEIARKQNYGVDIDLFNNRFSASFDYFFERREDILMTRNTDPGFLAIDQPPVNIGIMENRGFEVVVGYNGNAGELQYNVSVNVSKAQNQVIFTDEISPLEPYQSRTGQPFQTNFGYRYLGFYTQQEVDVINAQRDQGTVSDRTYPIPDFATTLAAGDLKYADLNGDGIINLADQEVFGDPSTPQVNGGLSGGISYKGFDISFGFQFATEVSRNLNGVFRSPFYFSNDLALLQTHYDDAWTPETAETARWPRRTFQNAGYNQVNSSFWVRDASYLRLRNAEIGYSFNRNVLDKIGLSGLRVYMRGNNLFTLQKEELEWVDPEQELRQSFGYPLVRIARLGLNVTF